MSNNPLNNIFLKGPQGNITEELDNINNIKLFFNFINNDKVEDEEKEIVFKDLTSKLQINRYISEFFSTYENKSIYIYLFDLYCKDKTSQKLKDIIVTLIEQLLFNIQTGKEIYEYIFQKLSEIYRGEIPATENNLYNYLKLLKTISSEIDSRPPKYYFACSGHCQFGVDLNKILVEVGRSFTLNINFKISQYEINQKKPENNRISTLIKIYFANKKTISIDLQYPFLLIVKEIRKEYIKTLPLDEWINLAITIVNNKNDIQFHFFVNGENNMTPYKIEKFGLRPDTAIKYIDFFNNFYGEVSSVFMFSQRESGNPGANNSNYLSQLKNYAEGLWKKSKIDSFFKVLKSYEIVNKESSGSKTISIKSNNSMKLPEKKKTLFENLVFIFTPLNWSDKNPNIVEDIFGRFQMQFSGNIRVHRYQSYQKKLVLCGGFSNFYPIAEMFLIYPGILTEKNFEIFLKTINNILNFRKQNLLIVNKSKLFKILSMFMEKYPKKVYTENILNALFSLGKTLFINNLESECTNYFNYILLNEKILSKYNENLQSNFWNKFYLFCQSDITQVQAFLNINRLCLILRFYDRNKYQEMCCQEHLDIIKTEYIGSKKVMNPTMNTKLSQLKDIMNLIIDSSESNNALSFFKLLTLDLSPCLIKFIINIFIKAFDKQKINENWKKSFIEQLIEAKYEVIIFNTFIHALPDVRVELLKFINQIHNRMVFYKKDSNIKTLEEMIKTCLLPEKMFYHKKILPKENDIKKISSITDKPKKTEQQKNKEETKNKTNIIPKISDPKNIETKKEEIKKIIPPKESHKKEEQKIIVKKNDENEIKKIEDKKEGKKEEPKKIETGKKEIEKKLEIKKENEEKNIIKEELKTTGKKEIEKIDENKKESQEKKNKKEDSGKETPKKEQNKNDKQIRNSVQIKEETKKPPLINPSQTMKEKKPELKQAKTFQVSDNKTNPISDKRKNFLALLSKFDKPKNEQPIQEHKRIPSKLTSKDNPFLKKINSQAINSAEQNKKLLEEEKKKKEKERLEKERLEKERLEKERLEKERLEKERLEKERLEQERLEKERLEQERLEKERLEQERLEQERLEKERLEKERLEKERLEQERLEQERLEKERLEKERLEQERLEQERLEKERLEQEKLEKIEKEKKELSSKNNLNKNSLELDEEIIIKDKQYNEYIEKLYSIFILWSLSIDVSIPHNAITFTNCYIKYTNGMEILFLLNKKIQNQKYVILFLNTINTIAKIPDNAYQIFCNMKIFSSFLDTAFQNHELRDIEEETCFNLSKNIIIYSFANSFDYCEKNLPNKYPGKDLETLFIWGDKVIQEDTEKKGEIVEFIFDLLMEFLTQFKIKYEPKIILNSDKAYDVNKNYFMKNYLYLINCIFTFVFRFRLDDYIFIKGPTSLYNTSSKITIQEEIIKSMRMIQINSFKIGELWKDFPLINEIISKAKNIWSKKNCYKGLKMDNFKNSKYKKYDYIIDNIITNKEKKNMYQKELEFLCFEEKDEKFERLIPLIKMIPLTLISILSKLKNFDDDKDFKYWLKELKYFIRYLIISTANLIKINQLELYNYIQDKALESIAIGFCFLHYLLSCSRKSRDKIEHYLISLLLLTFKILKYQYNYKLKHKKVFNFANKPTRNNLEDCAICKLFDSFVKDNTDNAFMNINLLESLNLENNNYRNKILNLIKSSDFIDAFFENKNLKNFLTKRIYSLSEYKNLVDNRYDLISNLQDDLDNSYKKTILQLLPKYESELAKYSNNSLEKNIKNKNRYKVFKKNAFSWRGFWSKRDNFFKNISSFKFKMINHYTKNFMKPILEPIIDISYYLPEFSGFDPKNLFLPDKEDKIYKLNMDIDKVLKTTETNIQDNVTNNNKEKENNYLVNIYKKSNPLLYEKLLKISNNLEFGKEEEFSFVERDSSKEIKKKYYLSCLVKTSHHIKGVVFIDDKKLNFKVFLNQRTGSAMSGVEVGFTTKDDDYDQERKTCFGSFFVCHPKDKDLYKISINYKDIKWIFKRKYYYNNSAIEIFTTTNKTFYFNFKYENDKISVLKEILKKLDEPIPIIDDLKESKSQNIIGYENGIVQKQKGLKLKSINLSKIVKSWKNWEISNFEFLMWLNIFGNRSYNDISQYPVFPWILINYEDPLQVEQQEIIENATSRTISMALPMMENPLNFNLIQPVKPLSSKIQEEKTIIDYLYRDMSLPMGMLEISDESIKRKEEFDMNYETLLEMGDENNKPYVFGSNYSNPIYVCNYLMRLFPFTHISIELQGKGFDKPDRLFLSVKNSFFNSTSQKGDVRELIPEFFYLPEMFRNINKLNMGKLENGEQVGDVLTPCDDNPYDFIMTMRSCLENDKLSYKIQEWIDLIFGYKSRGKEAERVKNIYKEASYQETIDINKIENKESKLREVEFGLVPNQLMIKECSKRDKREIIRKGKEITNAECDLKCYECKYNNENEKFKGIEGLPVVKMSCFNQDKIQILLGGQIYLERKITYSIFDKSYSDEPMNPFVINKFINRMSEFYNPKKPDSKVIQFCQKGKTVIFGGFYDGKILIKSTSPEQKDNYKIDIPFIDKSPIVAIAVDQEDEFAFFGNEMGNIRIMKLNKDIKESKFDLTITDHLSTISYINCSSELNLWVSASIDGYINLYTLPLSKLLRSLKVDTPYCDYAFLSASPLPSIVVIGEENKMSEIFVYSINGELYSRQKEEEIIKNPIILKDLNSNEYLAYIINESIIIRAIPTLIRQSSIDDIPDVYCIYPSEDMKILYAINRTGTNIKIIKNGI